MTVVTYTTPTTANWMCPAGVASILAEFWGAGGVGGTSSSGVAGGGGGGGGYCAASSLAVTGGSNYSYTVGAAAGSDGGYSTFIGGSNPLGGGGTHGAFPPSTGGGGGGGSGGTVSHGGGAGFFSGFSGVGGGGGGSGGSTAAGTTATTQAGGAGGATGGAYGGVGGGTGAVGGAGNAPGGGGGGGASGIHAGGAGANGQVQITYAAPYTVTFNNNGGTGAMTAEVHNVATALTTNTFTRATYAFTGWDTVAGGGGTAYADGASYPFNANVTLYAQWVLATSAPSAPTLTTPANASYQEVVAGLAFAATYNSTDTLNQNAYAMRIKVSGGSYQYWNAGTSALQASEVWNTDSIAPGGTFGVTLPGTAISDGNVYNWSFRSQEAGSNLQGTYASDFTFTAQQAPGVSVTAPTGTIAGTTSPLITWTESLSSGSQIDYQIEIESGAYSTTPGSGTSAWNSGVIASASQAVTTGVALTSGVTYRVFVQITGTGGQVSAWQHSDSTLVADTPAQPTVAAVAYNDPTTELPEAKITVQGYDNQLTANQASLETGATTGWAAGANTTLAASATWVMDGAYSLAMTATAGGAVQSTTPTGVSAFACSPGKVVRAMGFFHSPTTPRVCTVAIVFYNAAGSVVSTSTSANVNSDTTSGAGAQAFISATAPALTATYALVLNGASLGAGEALYADELLLAPGTSTTWTAGGFVGTTKAAILRSDGQYVRGAGWPVGTSVTIPSATQNVVVYDPEVAPGTAYTYTAVITTGSLSSAASAASAAMTLSPTSWDIMDPLNPSGGTKIEWAGDTRMFDQPEIQGVSNAFGRSSSIVVRGQMLKEAFDLILNFGGDSDVSWQTFNALRKNQVPVLLRGDMPGDLFYMALGPARPMILARTGDRVANPSRSLTIHCNPVDRP